MDIGDLSRDAAQWALFLDAVNEIELEKRAALVEALGADGVERVRTDFGLVTYSRGKPTAVVTNERALLEWVRQRHPEMLLSRVNPAYIAALKRMAEREGVASDRDTGEVVPGIEIVNAGPGLRIVKDPDAREAARGTVRKLAERGLRALEEAGPDE